MGTSSMRATSAAYFLPCSATKPAPCLSLLVGGGTDAKKASSSVWKPGHTLRPPAPSVSDNSADLSARESEQVPSPVAVGAEQQPYVPAHLAPLDYAVIAVLSLLLLGVAVGVSYNQIKSEREEEEGTT